MRNYLTDETKPDETKPNNETNETTDKLSIYCQSNCKTCSSIHYDEIFDLKFKKNKTLREISEIIKKKYNEYISISSLSHHFSKYTKQIKERTEQKMIVYMEEDVDKRAIHAAKLTTLIDEMFKKIAVNWDRISPTIENLEKLIKLKEGLVNRDIGFGDFDEQVTYIIQNADKIENKQLSLFQPQKEPETKKPE